MGVTLLTSGFIIQLNENTRSNEVQHQCITHARVILPQTSDPGITTTLRLSLRGCQSGARKSLHAFSVTASGWDQCIRGVGTHAYRQVSHLGAWTTFQSSRLYNLEGEFSVITLQAQCNGQSRIMSQFLPQAGIRDVNAQFRSFIQSIANLDSINLSRISMSHHWH